MSAQLAAFRSTIFARAGNPRSARARLLGALLIMLALPFAPSARGDQPVAVRTGIHDGFGRLVLEWPAPVAVAGRQEGSRYRLRFEQPLEIALDLAVARLGDFLASARPGPDGRDLTLELRPGVAVRQHLFDGRILVLDLWPAGAVAPPEQVEVRTGLHDGFARIVFHWPLPIIFDAHTTDRQVEIRFARPGQIDAGAPAARLSAWVANASASRSEGRSDVRLELQPGVTARVIKVDGNRVAVDLFGTPAQPADSGAAGNAQAAPPARPGSLPALAAAPEPAPPPPQPVAAADLATAAAMNGGGNDDGAEGGSAAEPGATGDRTVLDFAWAGPAGAAVFVRAGYLWVVFAGETSPPEDLAVPPALRDDLGPGERMEASGGAAIRFALRRPHPVVARRENGTWRVRVSADAQAPPLLYPLRLASPARLRLDPGEPPRLVVLRDPETGDLLTVWPLAQADLGQPRQSLVDLELLPTVQGLAWRLRSDRVRARIFRGAVEFDAPGGLALSEPPETTPSAPAVAPEPESQPSAPAAATEPGGQAAAATPAARTQAPAAQAQPAPEPPPIVIPDARSADAVPSPLGLVG